MSLIYKTTVVPYKPVQMYTLVNDVEAYPAFLPWCNHAVLKSHAEERLIATLTVGIGKVKHEFTTENKMLPGRRIDIELLDGPFDYLNGYWQFDDVVDDNCLVTMEMEFEFKNRLMCLTLNKLFEQMNSSLVEVFTRRAHQIYGTNSP